jgi:hypothetical protein
MKKFTEVINIEVPVQSIAELLLNNLHPDFRHKEIVAESIVGRMMNDNSLGYLYNALNGYPCNIDFEVGDEVYSEQSNLRVYGYWTAESIERNDTVMEAIYAGRVVEINPYKNAKLRIEFEVPNKKGGFDTKSEWVNHKYWNRRVLVEKDPTDLYNAEL